MAVSNDGSVFVTGQTKTIDNFVVLALWRYDINGTLTMLKTWKPTPYDKFPVGVAVASDGVGGAFVAGTFKTPMQGTDIVVLHYDVNGGGGLIGTFNGAGNGDDYAVNISVDLAGNAWVGGVTQGAGTGADYLIKGYSSTGPLNNAQATFDHAGLSDLLVDIDSYATTTTNNAGDNIYVYVTGTSYESPAIGTQEDIQTLGYVYNTFSDTFVQFFSPRYATFGVEKATSITALLPALVNVPHGSVYVSGYRSDAEGGLRILTLGYPEEGIPAYWTKEYTNPYDVDAQAISVKLVAGVPNQLPSGEQFVFVAGDTLTPSGQRLLVRAFDRFGGEQWTYLSDTEGADIQEDAVDIDMVSGGDLYVTMKHSAPTNNVNYRTIKLLAVGPPPVGDQKQWDIQYDGGFDVVRAVRVHPINQFLPDVYVTGESTGPSLPTTYTTFRYFQTQ